MSNRKYSICSVRDASNAFCNALKSGAPCSPGTMISPSSQPDGSFSAWIAVARLFIFEVQSLPLRVNSRMSSPSIRVSSR